ncbi:lmo0937 family membrane protein [Novosphingobium terrae]|uniref:lmo0937 family membrane protein n=1 Tax=Novosphingobium terrae TaxID=2726189 RepID=UPI00197D63CB|nr:lmo0937 family membrane protein [Novosphingobium terrae]
MFLGLFGILVLAWLISFVVLHVTSGLIHLLLLFAVASIIIHFFTGNKRDASA